jgi:predicted nucleic acid-binding protein
LAFTLVTGEWSQFDLTDASAAVSAGGAIVPRHWELEIANALTIAVRTKRLSADRRTAIFEDLTQLGTTTDSADIDVFGTIVGLADKHRLTVYDAAYLELAVRSGHALGSLDSDLRRAAKKEGVALLPA